MDQIPVPIGTFTPTRRKSSLLQGRKKLKLKLEKLEKLYQPDAPSEHPTTYDFSSQACIVLFIASSR